MRAYGRRSAALFLFSPSLSSVELVGIGSPLLSAPPLSLPPAPFRASALSPSASALPLALFIDRRVPPRLASRLRPCPTRPSEGEGRAAIGRENRGIQWGAAIGWRGPTGAGTTPTGNSSRSCPSRKNVPLMLLFCPLFCVTHVPHLVYISRLVLRNCHPSKLEIQSSTLSGPYLSVSALWTRCCQLRQRVKVSRAEITFLRCRFSVI